MAAGKYISNVINRRAKKMGNESGTWIMHGLTADDPECILTVEQLKDFIEKVGFIPLFKNEIPGFSVEEHTLPDYWWSGDKQRDPWEWREIIAGEGKIAYGKFFDKKAGFISREWLPTFVNYRRDGYDFDALWEDGKAQLRQKRIMDLFDDDTEMFSNELKAKAGFGKGGEKNFEGIVTSLQMELYLCVRDFRQRVNKQMEPYGWPISVYCKPEHLWGYGEMTAAYSEDPAVCRDSIIEHVMKLYPGAATAVAAGYRV